MSDRIAITGANSAVGRALLRLAEAEGRPWVACVRSQRARDELPFRVDPDSGRPRAADASAPAPGWPPISRRGRIERVDYARPDTLAHAFRDVAAVVHLPGLLIERRDSSYTGANVTPVRSAVQAAERAGVAKLVLVSAVGAAAGSANRYYASKAEAEACVRGAVLEHTILRAPLVLGPGTEGEAALRRYVAGPRARLLDGGRACQQPLDVEDLARAALRSTRVGVAAGRTLDLVGPESLPYAELVVRCARTMGRAVRVEPLLLPVGLLRWMLRLRRRVLGPGGFSADALDVILDAHAIDPKPAAEALGIELTPLDVTLRRMFEKDRSR